MPKIPPRKTATCSFDEGRDVHEMSRMTRLNLMTPGVDGVEVARLETRDEVKRRDEIEMRS